MNVLEGVRGVSFISNGTTAVKPVIQGMYGNRILLVNNGVNHAGQQWGDEHSPEIDWNSARSISVIKGVQTVKYGPDALGEFCCCNLEPCLMESEYCMEILRVYTEQMENAMD